MKKLLLLLLSFFFLASCSSVEENITPTPSNGNKNKKEEPTKIETLEAHIQAFMDYTNSYEPSWNQEQFKNKWNYIDGVFLKSYLSLYEATNDTKYIEFVINFVDYYLDDEGNFIHPNGSGGLGFTETELDSVCESNILFDLYNYTNDQIYLNAINNTYTLFTENVPKLPDNICYSHKAIYPDQVWLDGFYMYAPFTTKYALGLDDETEKNKILDDLYNQYKFVREHLYDEDKELYYHGYSATPIFWAQANGCSQSFWLRSNGWLLASLPEVLEFYPEGEHKEYLKNMYVEAIQGILKYQDKDSRLFYQVLDRPNESTLISYNRYLKKLNNIYSGDTEIANYLETSGSLLVSYSILKARRLGILNEDYEKIGNDIFNGVINNFYDKRALRNICLSAGLGPLIMCYSEVKRR